MNLAWFYLTPLLAMTWSAGMTALGVSRAARRAALLGAIPLGLATWHAPASVVLDPHDVAATYVPMFATLAVLVTVLGAACYAAGRLAFLKATR